MSSEGSASIQQLLKQLLVDFANRSPILGAAIFSVEGLPLISHFLTGTEEVSVAAMVAGIHSAGEQTVRELKQGNLRSIIIQGEMGTTVVISIAGGYLLTITAPENTKMGLVFNDGKQVARRAGALLQGLI
ncbi:MAG: roadblock/LC7 domain-containing protein [Candidatus Thorarchaeota archaeon]|nr:MAG: roadblock/LC7 domain-containing protein [Candidatus Thorarchaeota archaeon]